MKQVRSGMGDDDIREMIFKDIIGAEIACNMSTYAPDRGVITISNIMRDIPNTMRYRVRKALKSLIADGLIEYTSQGCPAVVSCGEIEELLWESGPPINGYALTKKAFQTAEWKKAYAEWEKSLEEWANGFTGEEDAEMEVLSDEN